VKNNNTDYPGSEWGYPYMEQCTKNLFHDISNEKNHHPTKLGLIRFKTLEYMTRIISRYPMVLKDKVVSQYVHSYLPEEPSDVPSILNALCQRLKDATIPAEPFLDPFAMRLESLQRSFFFTPQSIEVLVCMFLFHQVHCLRRASNFLEPSEYHSDMHILEMLKTALGWKEEPLLECLYFRSQLAEAELFDPNFGYILSLETNHTLLGLRQLDPNKMA